MILFLKKVVLVSSPSSVESIITSFSKVNNLTESEKIKLKYRLENEFEFSISDYCVSNALKNISKENLFNESTKELSFSAV